MSDSTLRTWLDDEPFTLTMSSGFFGFFAHAGMLAALRHEGIEPVAFRGSSAGALVGSFAASGLSDVEIRELLHSVERKDFWDPSPGFGLLKGRYFEDLLQSYLPVATFEACEKPVTISAFDIRSRKTASLRSGPLRSAIRASCAVPFMFHPVRHQERYYLDGGILDRPGLHGAPQNERIFYHHLLSSSKWRRKNEEPPNGSQMTRLTLHGLTRVAPHKLENGRQAYVQAYENVKRMIDEPHRETIDIQV